MLWYVRSLLGLISAVCAVLSPLCVIHWLLRLSPFPIVQKAPSFLDPVFLPAAKAIDLALPASIHAIFGNQSEIGQGILSVGLTAAVIITAFLAKMAQVTETQSKVRANNELHHRIMKENLARRAREQEQKQTAEKLVLFLRHKDSAQAEVALARCQQAEGEIILQSDEQTIILFKSLEAGLAATQQSARWVKSRMQQLRPSDARPDYRFILHAIDKNTHPQEAAYLCQGLERFCKSTQVLCTQAVNDVIQIKKLPFELSSLGFYDLAETQSAQELFHVAVDS